MERFKRYTSRMILPGFIILLLICNLPLFHGSVSSTLIFKREMVAAGEWWRIITHLFVHVSWYHLLLDGAAVALLWREIYAGSLVKKIFVATICGASSLAAAVWFSPYIEQSGYCGLSGLAHGLMFFLGLSWIKQAFSGKLQGYGVDSRQLTAGIILASISGVKSIIEVITGSVLFSQLHMGDLGQPIVEAHLGGVMGGLVAFMILMLSGSLKMCLTIQYIKQLKI